MKKALLALTIALASILSSANAQNLRDDRSLQTFSILAGAEMRKGEDALIKVEGEYANYFEKSHLMLATQFGVATNDKAYYNADVKVGFHFGSKVKFYFAGVAGMGTLRQRSELYNQEFDCTKTFDHRYFVPEVGGALGLFYQGRTLGIGVECSYKYLTLRHISAPWDPDMVETANDLYKDPFAVSAKLSYNLSSGKMSRNGNFTWAASAGYMLGIGEGDSRAYARLGQTFRQGFRWSLGVGAQFEECLNNSRSFAGLYVEERFFAFGSETIIRPKVGAKFGFGERRNTITASASYDEEYVVDGVGVSASYDTYTHKETLQPGLMMGGYVAMDAQVLSHIQLSVGLDYTYVRNFGTKVTGYDKSTKMDEKGSDLAIFAGVTYSF